MKTALLVFAIACGLSAQPQNGSYRQWYTSYGAVVSSDSPVGYTNDYELPGEYAPDLKSWATCVSYPAPNVMIQMDFVMGGSCPEGVYISEDGSNGFFADPNCSPVTPACSIWNIMVQNGTKLDGAVTSVVLEIFQMEYSCINYYLGPIIDYDDVVNPCQE